MDVKIIEIGIGKVISNWGTYEGHPAVFIEPVLGKPCCLGERLKDNEELQITNDSVSNGSVILVFKGSPHILIEDIQSALSCQLSDKNLETAKARICGCIGKCVGHDDQDGE